LIKPPNFCGGGGNCLPSSVIVALGEPGVPWIVWASDALATSEASAINPRIDAALPTRMEVSPA